MDSDKLRSLMAEHAESIANQPRSTTGSMLHADKNCMSYWYPRIEGSVPTPKTHMMKIADGSDLLRAFDGERSIYLSVIVEFVMSAWMSIDAEMSVPVFLRSGQTSYKHAWSRSCFVAPGSSKELISSQIMQIVEFSEICDLFGLDKSVWVVREFLKTKPVFTCSAYGEFPVVREQRFFAMDGKVLYSIPYWPEKALEDGSPSDPEWRDKMEFLNTPIDGAEKLAETASGCCEGECWSIDILEAEDGIYVTDMAIAARSYGWDENRASESKNTTKEKP